MFALFSHLLSKATWNFYARYTLESGSRCVRIFKTAGEFGPVFVEGKAEYFLNEDIDLIFDALVIGDYIEDEEEA